MTSVGIEQRYAWRWPARWTRLLTPTTLVALVLAAYLGVVLARSGGDARVLARLGDGFVAGRPVGAEGYDGQFVYWIAVDPRPASAAPHLDVPAYRYQRILYPLLARVLAGGWLPLIPWTLAAVNVAAHLAGTWSVEHTLASYGASRWYALTYGLWAGLVMAVRLDLTEPLSYALVAAALLALRRERLWLSAGLLGLSLLAKETGLPFWLALLAWGVLARRREAALAYGLAVLPFIAWQAALWRWFGTVGLASGGYLATAFEWIPYMGLWRVAWASVPAFIVLAVIFGPLVVLPSAWGIVAAARRLWQRDIQPAVLTLGANAALLAFTPLATYREPLAIIRLASGLVLATVLFGAAQGSRRVLNYSLAWMCALALAVRE